MDIRTRQERGLQRIPGIARKVAVNLINAGLVSLKQIERATDDELLAVEGIDAALVRSIRRWFIEQRGG